MPRPSHSKRDGIGARHIFASHSYLTDPPLQPSSVLRHYPDAILIRKEMDTWAVPEPDKKILDPFRTGS